MLAIRLPQSIEKAILECLDDLKDLYLAERALERTRGGEERTIAPKKTQ